MNLTLNEARTDPFTIFIAKQVGRLIAVFNATLILGAIMSGPAVFCGEIQDAARQGDLAKVEALLKSNPKLINDNPITNLPPLLMAIAHQHIEIAKFLLANNADVNIRGAHGFYFGAPSALHLAAHVGNYDEAKLLLEHHANINATNDFGQTPLHIAIHNDATNVVQLLLENKAEVNLKDNEGKTPLHIAAEWWRDQAVEWLITRHADVNAKDKTGQTPLHAAVQHGQVNIAKLLLAAGADANATNDKGQTPFQLAESLKEKDELISILKKASQQP